jgi:outer membrane protein assembly factor BamB
MIVHPFAVGDVRKGRLSDRGRALGTIMQIKTLGMLGAALCAVMAVQAQATPFYSTGNNGSTLFTVDSDTGASSAVGDFGYGSTYALAFDAHNTLYGLTNGFDNGTLATIDKNTGAATLIGVTNISDLMALVFAPDGTLYAASWSTNELYTLDTHTGAATDIGNLGFGNVMDLAFDSHGTLYGIGNGLYSIDTSTGAGTQIAGTVGDGCMMGMTIKADEGYVTDYCSGDGALYKMSLTDGSLTSIGSTFTNSPMALTYEGVAGSVPEPASWALMIGGFGMVGAAMRRRRSVAVSFG